MEQQEIVLCAASAYEKKFYLNQEFQGLPQGIKDELKIMCVLFTEDVGGVVELIYEELSREENGYHPEQFAGSHKEALIDMEAGIRAMLETYCGMTKQDLERLSQISSQELMLLIGRRIGFYD